ncbi:MAG TPA: Holliday junction resolvase RecU, partial [Sedimentibacter sp.]|nr:Holliday junction resolvase RecU [Sedimentibacter sp.]
KSTKAKSISFDGSSPMIKKHQLKELERALCYGINAGFLLNFRTSETTYYVKLEDLKTFISSTDKKSINVKEVKEIGIEIPTQKLKVNYRYDLSVFVK